MPQFCGVVGCGHNSLRDGKEFRFFRIPAETNTRGKVDPKKRERRQRWIQALHRADLTESKLKNMRICSAHFSSGKPAADEATDHPDYIPHVSMGYETRELSSRYDRLNSRKRKQSVQRVKEGIKVMVVVDSVLEEGSGSSAGVVMVESALVEGGGAESSGEGIRTTTSQQNESGSNFQMESHRMFLRFPKRERVFNCADSIEPLKCFQCTNFQTHELVDLKEHFKEGHTLPEKEDTFYCCENCSFQTHSNCLYLLHELHSSCKTSFKVKLERTDPEPNLEYENENFQCHNCPFMTPFKSVLDDHLIKEHKFRKSASHKCEHCAYVCQYRKHLDRHILFKHTDPDKLQWFKCEHCPYKGKTKANLKSHLDYKHGVKEYLKCDYCSFETKHQLVLKRHILLKHTDPDKSVQWFECEHCSYTTKIKSNLKKHINRKHNRTEIKCELCQFKATSNRGLQIHIIQKHSDPDKIQWFECEQCPYKSQIKANLNFHVDYNHSEKELLKCDYCSFETKHKRALRNHILLKHADPDKLQWLECEHCSYTTKMKSTLQTHISRKHNSTEVTCDICQFKTNSNQGLQTHIIQKHSDPDTIEWFKCEQCPYTSSVKANFKRHVATTHGERDTLKCEHCEFITKLKKSLRRHISRKHGDPTQSQWFRCGGCSYRTQIKEYFGRHVARQHRPST